MNSPGRKKIQKPAQQAVIGNRVVDRTVKKSLKDKTMKETKDQPAPPRGFGIDSRIGAAAPRAPAAILKFHRLSSLDYRVRHKLPVIPYHF